MKILNLVLISLIVLLSIAAGMAKVFGSPQEVEFLQGFGFSSALIFVYGLVQVIGGVLLAIPKTLRVGSIITVLGFTLSSILIAVDGNYVFALISLLPIVITIFIYWYWNKALSDKAIEPDV